METLLTDTISHSAQRVFNQVLEDLKLRLPKSVTYHNVRHTLDVVDTCKHYISIYDLDDSISELLLIAAVAHDYGFVISPTDHERRSSDLVSEIMVQHDFDQESIELVRGLIMATKIPQSPKTFFEEIIADADLDYLGREDYGVISATLFNELKNFNNINSEKDWYDLQIKFLQGHTYFTEWAQRNRQPIKEERISILKEERARRFGGY